MQAQRESCCLVLMLHIFRFIALFGLPVRGTLHMLCLKTLPCVSGRLSRLLMYMAFLSVFACTPLLDVSVRLSAAVYLPLLRPLYLPQMLVIRLRTPPG
jgi:hypothetical protein